MVSRKGRVVPPLFYLPIYVENVDINPLIITTTIYILLYFFY